MDLEIRNATPADGPALAGFINMASGGLTLYLWLLSAGGGDPWSFGADYMASKLDKGPVVVIDGPDGPIAGLGCYPAPDLPDEVQPGDPPEIHPMIELERLFTGSWYVNFLAVLPGDRGRGLGHALLQRAEAQARAAGRDTLTLTVADTNQTALRLYQRHGYAELARAAAVRDGWQGDVGAWLALAKRL